MYKIDNKILNVALNTKFLMDYQQKIMKFMESNTYKSRKLLLLYMDTGTGKTLTSIACAASLIMNKNAKKIVVLSPKSIQQEFVQQFNKFCTLINDDELDKNIKANFISICYNSSKTYEYFKSLKHYDNTVYIIDEAHLFLRAIMKTQVPDIDNEIDYGLKVNDYDESSFSNNGQCQKVYTEFRKLTKSYFLFLTATPSAKTPFETVAMFNLAGCGLPENIEIFMNRYFKGIEMQNSKEIKTILKGLVARVKGNDKLQKLKALPLEVREIEMSSKQYIQYLEDYKQELKEKGYIRHVNKYGWGFGQISSFHAKTFGDSVYVPLSNKKSKQIVDKIHAPKVIEMYKDSSSIHGKCCIYFRFVDRGVNTFKQCLEDNGYKLFDINHDKDFKNKAKRYVLFTGIESIKLKYEYMKYFNDPRNCYGNYIKYILLSPSGSVGLNLLCIRYLGIGCVEYNYSAIRQIMGRCNRLNSHMDLPVLDRTLVNIIYLAVSNKEYIKKHYKELSKWYTRIAPGHNEKFPSIERCIYQDALFDDKVNTKFRTILEDISII